MAKHKYRIASLEGADKYGGELDEEKTLDLSVDEKRAVVAAGWVEELDKDDDDKGKK